MGSHSRRAWSGREALTEGGSFRGVLPQDREVLAVGRESLSEGWEALPEGWKDLTEGWKDLTEGREALLEDREWSGGPPGGSGVVGRPSCWAGSGQEALPEGW